MKIQLKLRVPLPAYNLTNNIKVALDKDNKYIYVQSELSVRAGLCAACTEVREKNIEVDFPVDEESQFTVIHLVLFKIVDFDGNDLYISKEEFNKQLKSYCDYVDGWDPSFLNEHFILSEYDSMIQNFEVLHKAACLPFTLIKPVKEKPKPILSEEDSTKAGVEFRDLSKTSLQEQSEPSLFNYELSAATLVAISTIGFFAFQAISEVMSTQESLGLGALG